VAVNWLRAEILHSDQVIQVPPVACMLFGIYEGSPFLENYVFNIYKSVFESKVSETEISRVFFVLEVNGTMYPSGADLCTRSLI
jgi:hypothetical protein